jgi:carboxymethylenebutenolidase
MPLFRWSGAIVVLLTLLNAAPARAQPRSDVAFPVKDGTLSGVVFRPAKTPAPAVLVLHTKGAGGHEPADEAYAQALADAGFVAVVVNYLELADGKLWSPKIDAELARVVDLVRERPEAKEHPVGIVGFSLGAHAILVSARSNAVKAVVVYYGAYDARKAKGMNFGPAATMPVDMAARVGAPVLMLHGDKDNEAPIDVARDMAAALKAAGKTAELVIYPGAYHRFDRGPTERMKGDTNREGFIYRYDDAAARDAWRRTVAFLRAHLGG